MHFVVAASDAYDKAFVVSPMGEIVTVYPAFLVLSSLLALGSISQAHAVDSLSTKAVEIDAVSSEGALKLGDGGTLCLAGIWAPAASMAEARAGGWQLAWRRIIGDGGFRYPTDMAPRHDRYGCVLTDLENDDGLSLADRLLEAGWASVDPTTAPEDPVRIDTMLGLEDEARRARRGLWEAKAHRPKAADRLSDWIGTRQIVEGRVRRVSSNERYFYLNFGADWRTDFTTRLDRRMIETIGLTAADYDGKKLRVRGVLVESRGPLIDIAHHKQIEFLP